MLNLYLDIIKPDNDEPCTNVVCVCLNTGAVNKHNSRTLQKRKIARGTISMFN